MHDRDQFEVFLYALNADDGSPERRRMEEDVEHFRDLSALTAREAATTIENDGWVRHLILYVAVWRSQREGSNHNARVELRSAP